MAHLFERTRSSYIACVSGTLLALGLTACGTGTNANPMQVYNPFPQTNVLTAGDVNEILTNAAAAINVPLTIAVVDRRGQVLGVYQNAGASGVAIGNFSSILPADEAAIGLARTAAFFSNDQAPIGSRTVRFLSGIHFPPNVIDTESAPLYGIENTNRGCAFNTTYLPGQSVPDPTLLHSTAPGPGMVTGKVDLMDSDQNAVNPGGVPIFKSGKVAGGVGVVAAPGTANYNAIVEWAAVAGSIGSGFAPIVPDPGAVVLGGVTLPFVNQKTLPVGYKMGLATGTFTYGPVGGVGGGS